MSATKTDRERWAEPSQGLFAWSLRQGERRSEVVAGLSAFAAAWFDEYEDEDELPAAWTQFMILANELFHFDEDDDLPSEDDGS